LAAMYQAMTARGKPPKVALTAIMRKLIILANALIKADEFLARTLLAGGSPA
jgi:transposase